MNLKITSSVSLSIGGANVSNIVGTIVQHASINPATGGLSVPCDLLWWLDSTAMSNSKDLVWPTVAAGKVVACAIELDATEAAAANLPLTIYTKVAEKLATDYSWTVVVE